MPSRSKRNFLSDLSVLNNNSVLHVDKIIERTDSIQQLLRHQQKTFKDKIKPEKLIITAQQSFKTSDILHTVTYASHGGRDDRFCRAVESAIQADHSLVLLGWGDPWKGLSQKLSAAYEYAKSLPPRDVLLFTDAFDVMFTDSPVRILSSFLSMQPPAAILFAGECGCWPHIMDDPDACFSPSRYPEPPSPGSPYRYLNSGTWIGRAGAAAAMLEEVISLAGSDFENANDQKLVADMYMAKKHGIRVDFFATIFQSMHMTDSPPLKTCHPHSDLTLITNDSVPTGQIGSRYWINKRTHSVPAVFHFNGGGKVHHLQMEAQIWYKQQQQQRGEGDGEAARRRAQLADRSLRVISNAHRSPLHFKDICPSYLQI
eukprot:gene31196-40558_t